MQNLPPIFNAFQKAALHAQTSKNENLTGANVLIALFSERESFATHFLTEQDLSRIDVVNYVYRGITKVPEFDNKVDTIYDSRNNNYEEDNNDNREDHLSDMDPEPEIPEQTTGIRFTINEEILLDPLNKNDESKLSLRQISGMLPRVRKAAERLLFTFEGGSAPNAFPEIASDARSYFEIVNSPIEEINFGELWVVGVHLKHAAEAASREISNRLRPELEDFQASALNDLVAIHGPFILLSEEGQNLMILSERYNKTPEYMNEYKSLGKQLSESIQINEGLFSNITRERILKANQMLQKNNIDSKEIVTSETTNRNIISIVARIASFAVTSAFGGIIGAVITGSDLGGFSIEFGISNINQISTLIQSSVSFLLQNESTLRALASCCSDSLGWLDHFLSWLHEKRKRSSHS